MKTFIHLTDLHIGDPSLGFSGGIGEEIDDPRPLTDTPARLKAALARIATLEVAPSFIVVTGDLSQYGEAASYKALRDIMADVAPPVIYGLGNHDDRQNFYAQIVDDPARTAPYDHDVVIDGVHVITLDSGVPGKVGGSLAPEQFEFLAAALSRHADAPKVLAIHHPPVMGDSNAPAYDGLDRDDSARLGDMIEGGRVQAILCGHIHQSRVTLWRGTPVVVTTGLHNAIDPLRLPNAHAMSNDAAFALCTVSHDMFTVNYVSLATDHQDLGAITPAQIAAYEETLQQKG
ncbi:MAG: metallophosphoesterase [Pseudomonadota bacterium]